MINGIEFPFGQTKVKVISHNIRKQGLYHHQAQIRTSSPIDKTYLKHEVIDLVSRAVDFCPLKYKIRGSRVVLEMGRNHYEIHWNTESGELK